MGTKNERRRLNLQDVERYASSEHISPLKRGEFLLAVTRQILFLVYCTAVPPRREGYRRHGAQLWLLNFCSPSPETTIRNGPTCSHAMNVHFMMREKSVSTS